MSDVMKQLGIELREALETREDYVTLISHIVQPYQDWIYEESFPQGKCWWR